MFNNYLIYNPVVGIITNQFLLYISITSLFIELLLSQVIIEIKKKKWRFSSSSFRRAVIYILESGEN